MERKEKRQLKKDCNRYMILRVLNPDTGKYELTKEKRTTALKYLMI